MSDDASDANGSPQEHDSEDNRSDCSGRIEMS